MTEKDPWRGAVAIGRRMAGPGTKGVSRAEMDEAVAGLRAASERVPALVAEVSRLPIVPAGNDVTLVVDRTGIMTANADTMKRMLRLACDADPNIDVDEMTPPAAVIGTVLGVLASRILGQFDPFADQPRLLLVAPNIVSMTRKLDADPGDFRLWVCLHEQTHQAQFRAAPWLVDYLMGRVGDLVGAETDETSEHIDWAERLRRLRSTEADDRKTVSLGALAALAGPRTAASFDEVMAVMTLLEGYADVMMDAVGPTVIPTIASIRESFDAHRARGGLSALVGKMLGMDTKMAQYADGARFCRAVLDGPGLDTLNLAWAGARNLPSVAEIRDPALWIERITSGVVTVATGTLADVMAAVSSAPRHAEAADAETNKRG